MIEIKLFVTQITPKVSRQITMIQANLSDLTSEDYRVDVVEVIHNPELAYEYSIIATPTMLRAHPSPEKRIIGDLSNSKALPYLLNGEHT
jgi:circadian clock protein KaiB